jgi:hypothetical protein
LRLRTAEKCEAFRAFALNQGAQSLAKQGSYFGNACQSLGFGEQVIIECDCGPHALLLLAETLILKSLDDRFGTSTVACQP